MNDPRAPDPLRKAWQAATETVECGQACPDPDRIWEALQGGLSRREFEELVEHTIDCPACAEAWRLARDMGAMRAGQELAAVAPARTEQPPRWAFLRLRPLALAAGLAGLAVVAATTTWLWPDRPKQQVHYRDTEHEQIRALISEGQPLPRTACLLKWSPGPAGTRYSVRVSTEDFVQVSFVQGLDAAEYLVPAGDLKKVQPGTRLMWQVQAYPPEGGSELSETFFVTIK